LPNVAPSRVSAGGPARQPSQYEGLARWVAAVRQAAPSPGAVRAQPAPRRSRFGRVVAITGGKGGVGKSNVSLNFSLALAERGGRVLLIDCDSGLGNIDVLLGLCPPRHLGNVMAGECALAEAVVEGPPGLDILPAASGLAALGKATATEANRLLRAVAALDPRPDVVVLDTSAGLGAQVRALLRAVPEVLVVTTPEPTALADAYATLKVARIGNPRARICLLINMADGMREADDAAAGVAAVAERYLGWRPEYLGHLPRDASVPLAVRQQQPFLLWSPGCPAARAVRRAVAAWLHESGPASPAASALGGLGSVLRALWNAKG
jgi:flagellar biosynthesis protein FlhG